ncbi:glycerol-3-phosphate responsive antiterminator [Cetobacterium sp. 8H]|uniref:glycerol-3-phosphate responsive antiterminator n=1 Tax=Cetobacterium sp. 8H TaxID=2759681 RepID=UPI00163D285E|nr:glycerol-3-phosphate responsive antiterminator [Cetobacterium sp. 8H]MBC2850740.1 glycerol-3-phosphate responsive antiterminator [Cetobacterium sp. 8H]
MYSNFKGILTENKKIIAVKDINSLESAISSSSKIIFLLSSDICSIEETTRQIKASGKLCFIHLDMIQGLNTKDNSAIDYLKENTFADGVITTKSQVAKYAHKVGFLVVLRCFLIDSLSLNTTLKLFNETFIDAIEILPGVMPKIIQKLCKKSSIPIIAGGLISDEEDIEIALKSGAVAVSTTKLNIID